jgi:hypothetical protein
MPHLGAYFFQDLNGQGKAALLYLAPLPEPGTTNLPMNVELGQHADSPGSWKGLIVCKGGQRDMGMT